MPSLFSPVWGFLSVVVIAWITQRIIAYREHQKRIEETKLAIFMSWMPCIAEWYVEGGSPTSNFDKNSFEKKKVEILGILQIMGPIPAILAFEAFTAMAELGFSKDVNFNKNTFWELFTALNHSLCCEIHGEGPKDSDFASWLTQICKRRESRRESK
jgi:hypothetical protein